MRPEACGIWHVELVMGHVAWAPWQDGTCMSLRWLGSQALVARLATARPTWGTGVRASTTLEVHHPTVV